MSVRIQRPRIGRAVLFASFILAIVAGCSSKKPVGDTQCPDERPQVCPMIYQPVCAVTRQGQLATASSACNACSNDDITGYSEGACEAP